MTRFPFDLMGKPDSLWPEAEPGAETGVPPQEWHSLAVSAYQADQAALGETLERSFKALTQYYRHSCVGQRCLGIVHQMSTPLQILTFQLDLLVRHGLDRLQQLREQLDKLRDLMRNLELQGVHEDAREKVHLDLNRILRLELEHYLANPFFKHEVSKDFHFQEGLPFIHGYYIDFSQSFRNIIDNALEAMAGRELRRLTVMTSCQDNWILLRVGDTGAGIPPLDLPWIFEPFFTTKTLPDGEHAGLGLFMVRRLLAPYRAELRADGVPGRTWLSVALPVA